MENIWSRFEVWLKENFKDGYLDLNGPATKDELASVESEFSTKLPDEFKQCLSIHNGQAGEVGKSVSIFVDGFMFLSTVEIANRWNFFMSFIESHELLGEDYVEGVYIDPRDKGIKDDHVNSKWVPIADDRNGNYLCLDLDPSEEGHYGQVIECGHDGRHRFVLGVSFKEWFAQYVTDLENGDCVFAHGCVIMESEINRTKKIAQIEIELAEGLLRVRAEDEFPDEWAHTQHRLAKACCDLPGGDRTANVQRAINCYEAALRVYTEEALPQQWAMTQNLLGDAYVDLPGGDSAANVQKAIECYEAALRVYTEEAFPLSLIHI